MRTLRFARGARRDLDAALSFIEIENPEAALALLGRIREAAALLQRFPGAGRPQNIPGVRFLQVSGTAYGLVYREQSDRITILRIWHGARGWPPVS